MRDEKEDLPNHHSNPLLDYCATDQDFCCQSPDRKQVALMSDIPGQVDILTYILQKLYYCHWKEIPKENANDKSHGGE